MEFFISQVFARYAELPAKYADGIFSANSCTAAVKPFEMLIAGAVLAVFLGIYTIITLKKDESGCCKGAHTCHVCACGRQIRDVDESES
jgi:hypothetical protein